MKIFMIVMAAVLAATSSLAFAQAGSGSGATLPEKSGPAVNGGGAVVGNSRKETTGTTGTSRPSTGDASSQGAGPAGAADKKGEDTSPGGVMKK